MLAESFRLTKRLFIIFIVLLAIYLLKKLVYGRYDE